MKDHIYIIIAVFKRLEITRKCLESLQNQTFKNFTVILVDHCTTDDSYKSLIENEFPEVVLLKGDDSMWWTAATNFGINYVLNLKNTEESFILTLNNDLIAGDDYLEQLMITYNKYKPCLVGSVSVDFDDVNSVDFAGCHWNIYTTRMKDNFGKTGDIYKKIEKLDFIESDLLPGRGMLIPMEVFAKIGLFDNDLFPHYASDFDFSHMARKAGYKLIISPKAIVRSMVKETGLRFDKLSTAKPSLKFLYLTQTSIKSPLNIKTRFNWAKKHTILSPGYFLIDTTRILLSYFRYTLKYYINK